MHNNINPQAMQEPPGKSAGIARRTKPCPRPPSKAAGAC